MRGRYRELVADGVTGEDATNSLLAEWGEMLDDPDDAPAFWLALAETQSTVGRLGERVRKQAMELIESGEDLARFAHVRRLYARRRELLLVPHTGFPVKRLMRLSRVHPVHPRDA